MTVPIGESVTLDDIAAELESNNASAVQDAKLEGDDVPEELRGKTVKEAIAFAKATKDALLLSESERKKASETPHQQPETRVVLEQPRQQAQEVTLSKEQLSELFQSDPIAAVAYMNDKLYRQASGDIERRLAPLSAGAASAAEQTARARYADEFALFGPEISEIAKNITDKSFLGSPAAWEQIVSFVRGKEGNFDKLVEHKAKKQADKAREDAQEIQRKVAGFNPPPTAGGAPTEGSKAAPNTAGLDETERRIADGFIASGVFKDYSEYAKWQKMGG